VFNKAITHRHILDYAREMAKLQPNEHIVLPTKDELLDLLTISPDDCTTREIEFVNFFYKICLFSVNKTVRNNKNLMETHDVWSAIEDPFLWASAMAYLLLLLDKFSELKNIAHNYSVKETEGKMMKNKMRRVTNEDETSLSFTAHHLLFYGMRMHKDRQTRTQTRACFKNWETKDGVTGTTSNLKKRASVEPLRQDNTKNQKLVVDTSHGFDFYLNGPGYHIEDDADTSTQYSSVTGV
jgi:hypothetical protein